MSPEVKAELEKHLDKYPEAKAFLTLYGMLCHAVDDLIDRDNPAITDYKMLVLDCYRMAMDVFSSPFYQKNASWVYPLAANIHSIYSISVQWEGRLNWQGTYADALRCCGNEMIVAVLRHVARVPYAEERRLDALIREDSWARHHTPEGKPI